MGNRINTVMQPCFFKLSGVLPEDRGHRPDQEVRREDLRQARREGRTAQLRGHRSLARTPAHRVETGPAPASRSRSPTSFPTTAPDFVKDVTAKIMAGQGDLLPVSAFPVDGSFATATTKWEKRGIAQEIPVWDESICIDCGKCAMVCPHAAIRMKVYPEAELAKLGDDLQVQGLPLAGSREPQDHHPGGAGRLHRLWRLCRCLPGQVQDGGQAQGHQHGVLHGATSRPSVCAGIEFLSIPELDRSAHRA